MPVEPPTNKKKCFKCGITKPLQDFYRHPQMRDGRLNKCIECAKNDARENYRSSPTAHRDYERMRSQDSDRKKAVSDYMKRRRGLESVKIKIAARGLARRAIIRGDIQITPCRDCGRTDKLQAHHEDYNEPLLVVFLCHYCHNKAHGRMVLSGIENENLIRCYYSIPF